MGIEKSKKILGKKKSWFFIIGGVLVLAMVIGWVFIIIKEKDSISATPHSMVEKTESSENTENTENMENTENTDFPYDVENIVEITSMEELYLFNGGDVDNLEVYTNENGYISFISGSFSDIEVKSPEEAILSLYGIKTLMGCKSPKDELRLESTNSDEYGSVFNFEQVYKDIPVYGRSIVVATDDTDHTSALNSSFTSDIDISIKPSLSEKKAIKVVEDQGDTVITNYGLYIYIDDESQPKLVWNLETNMYTYLVDAQEGTVLLENPLFIID